MRVCMAWRGCAWACGWEGHKEVLDLEHLKHRAAAVADEGLSPESKGGTAGGRLNRLCGGALSAPQAVRSKPLAGLLLP